MLIYFYSFSFLNDIKYLTEQSEGRDNEIKIKIIHTSNIEDNKNKFLFKKLILNMIITLEYYMK